MSLADSQWLLIITAFVLGSGLGALAYHLMNAGAADGVQIRHKLTEKELEVSQLREGLNDHLIRTTEGLAALGKQLQNMELQVRKDAAHLCDDEEVLKRLQPDSKAEPDAVETEEQPATEEESRPKEAEPPRDYAAGSGRGTLAEDYGLKPEVFEPPRN